jgi:hypothetical protein
MNCLGESQLSFKMYLFNFVVVWSIRLIWKPGRFRNLEILSLEDDVPEAGRGSAAIKLPLSKYFKISVNRSVTFFFAGVCSTFWCDFPEQWYQGLVELLILIATL